MRAVGRRVWRTVLVVALVVVVASGVSGGWTHTQFLIGGLVAGLALLAFWPTRKPTAKVAAADKADSRP